MSRKLFLEIDPRVDELNTITAAVEQFGDAERWPPDTVFQINLVIEELGLNIMTHGKNEALEKIEITLTAKGSPSPSKSWTMVVRSIRRPMLPNLTWSPDWGNAPSVDSASISYAAWWTRCCTGVSGEETTSLW